MRSEAIAVRADEPDAGSALHDACCRLVWTATDLAFCLLDPAGRVVAWNPGAERLTGLPGAEVIGRAFAYGETPEESAAARTAALEAGRYETEGWWPRRDGSRFRARTVIAAVRDGDTLVGFAQVIRDATPQGEEGGQFEAVALILDLALSTMSQGLCLFDADGKVRLLNQRFFTMFAVAGGRDLVGMPIEALWALAFARPDAGEGAGVALLAGHEASLARGETVVVPTPDGRAIAVVRRGVPGGAFVVTFEDVTRQREAELEISRLAHHDALTGLANRAMLWRCLRESAEGESLPAGTALLFLDLDGFKAVNDDLGHQAGDALLQQVAERLRRAMPQAGLAARFGGDEFALLLPGRPANWRCPSPRGS